MVHVSNPILARPIPGRAVLSRGWVSDAKRCGTCGYACAGCLAWGLLARCDARVARGETLMIQLQQTIRRLFRAPGFTLTTVLTLGVGIGATIAIFSVVNGILLKPLPFPDSDRLIALVHRAPGTGTAEMAASPAFYLTYREHNTTFESVALWFDNTASVTGAGDPE